MATLPTTPDEQVSACTEPSTHPTREQVWKLAQLARSSEEALENIQEKLFFHLTHPNQFHVREIEHTLVVIQQCSFIAPLAFVNYFKDRIYAIAALTTFRPTTALPSDIKTVNQKARKLFELLRNDTKLQEERNKCLVPWMPAAVDDARFQPFPPRTPTPGETRIPQNVAASSSLPTPRSSPVQTSYEVKPEEEQNEHVLDDHTTDYGAALETVAQLSAEEIIEEMALVATANTPAELTGEQMDQISSSTFHSYTFQVVVSVLLERLSAVARQKTNYHLTKALRIIDHCLQEGSPSFVRFFKEHRGLIGVLCTYPAVNAVNSLATSIFNRLDKEDDDETVSDQVHTHGPASSHSPPTPVSTTSTIPDSDYIPLHEPVKDLTAFITNMDNYPFAHGGYSSVYKAKLSIGGLTEIVVKKVLISQGIARTQLEKRVNREVHIWTGLQNPNIASFYGITREGNGSIGLISPYFKLGNIVEYIKSVDKSQLNVLKIMIDITAGVSYLHGERIIHGDIKGSNVMADDQGNPKLIDFGVSRITGEHGYTTSGSGASWAWAAPELVPYDDIAVAKTIYSDIWALALTFLEVMTGRPPYGGLRLGAILAKFQQHAYPDRPVRNEECYFYPEDRIWALLLCCWDYTPEHRPAIGTIQGVLEESLGVSGM